MDFIVNKAGENLFRTPVPSEIPTDSFAEDYEIEDMNKIEKDLGLSALDKINLFAKKVQIEEDEKIDVDKKRTKSNKKVKGGRSR